jgi:hypothetical protein
MFPELTTNGSDSLWPSAAGTCDITFWGDVALRALAILPGQAVVVRGMETTARDPKTGKVRVAGCIIGGISLLYVNGDFAELVQGVRFRSFSD